MTALLSIPIASYCSIKRLALIYFLYAQQDHKLNENGIIGSWDKNPISAAEYQEGKLLVS
jgi:hypothetical protein